MAGFEQAPNSATLFKNKFKKGEKHPDYRGEFNNDGTIMDIALWERKTSKGDKYFFIKTSEKWSKDSKSQPSTPPSVGPDGEATPF